MRTTSAQAEDGAPKCKVNRMRWCHTDLGAVVYRWGRMMREDLRFGKLEGQNRFTGEDALMAELVVKRGWKVAHLAGQCLFDQGPSPQMCARLGGVHLLRAAPILSLPVFIGWCSSTMASCCNQLYAPQNMFHAIDYRPASGTSP